MQRRLLLLLLLLLNPFDMGKTQCDDDGRESRAEQTLTGHVEAVLEVARWCRVEIDSATVVACVQ